MADVKLLKSTRAAFRSGAEHPLHPVKQWLPLRFVKKIHLYLMLRVSM